MKIKNPLIPLIIFLSIIISNAQDCLIPVDMSTGIQLGNTNQGIWQVSPDGNSVTQYNNSEASFFGTMDQMINYKFTGTFKVNDNADNDIIGLAFGMKQPNSGGIGLDNYEMFLFDWTGKADISTTCNKSSIEGYTLTKVNGQIPIGCSPLESSYFFWEHNDDNDVFDIIATDQGEGKGWNHNTEYEVSLIYTFEKIIVIIDNDTIFNIDGCFLPGGLALYNFSQAQAVYSDISLEFQTSISIEPQNQCEGTVSSVIISCHEMLSNTDISHLDSLFWDFGDGTTLVNSNITIDNINPDHIWNEEGTYVVTLTAIDIYGCSFTTTTATTIRPFPEPMINDTILCEGELITYNLSSDYSYVWDNGNTSNSRIITGEGLYWVEISNDYCSIIDSFIVTPKPLPHFIISPFDSTLCEGETIILYAIAEYSDGYIWNDGSTSQFLTVNSSGLYSVTVSNQCGELEGDYEITVLPTVLNLDIPFDDTLLCEGVILQVDATIPYGENYIWSTGDNTSIIDLNETNTYHITVSNQCASSEDSFFAEFEGELPIVILDYTDSIICEGNIISLSANVANYDNYYWEHDSTEELTISISQEGEYTLNVSNICGMASSTASIIVNQDCIPFNVPSIFSPNNDHVNDYFGPRDFSLYPTDFKMTIYNRWGQPIYTSTDIKNQWDGRYDGNLVPPEVYIYIIEFSTIKDSNQIIKGDVTLVR